MCSRVGLLPALYSRDVYKDKPCADGEEKEPEGKAYNNQILLPYCFYSLLITKHAQLNVNCVKIPCIQLFKKINLGVISSYVITLEL